MKLRPIRLGCVYGKNSQANRVYSVEGHAPTLNSGGGGWGGKTGLIWIE